MPFFLSDVRARSFHLDRQCARFNDDLTGGPGLHQCINRLRERVRRRKRCDQDARLSATSLALFATTPPAARISRRRAGPHVIASDAIARAGNMSGNRRPHDAEADHPYC